MCDWKKKPISRILQPGQMYSNFLTWNINCFQHGFISNRMYFLIWALVNMQVPVFYNKWAYASPQWGPTVNDLVHYSAKQTPQLTEHSEAISSPYNRDGFFGHFLRFWHFIYSLEYQFQTYTVSSSMGIIVGTSVLVFFQVLAYRFNTKFLLCFNRFWTDSLIISLIFWTLICSVLLMWLQNQ